MAGWGEGGREREAPELSRTLPEPGAPTPQPGRMIKGMEEGEERRRTKRTRGGGGRARGGGWELIIRITSKDRNRILHACESRGG